MSSANHIDLSPESRDALDFFMTADSLCVFHKRIAERYNGACEAFESNVRNLAALYGRVLNTDQEEFFRSYTTRKGIKIPPPERAVPSDPA